jgi:hypothetical protein
VIGDGGSTLFPTNDPFAARPAAAPAI